MRHISSYHRVRLDNFRIFTGELTMLIEVDTENPTTKEGIPQGEWFIPVFVYTTILEQFSEPARQRAFLGYIRRSLGEDRPFYAQTYFGTTVRASPSERVFHVKIENPPTNPAA